MAKTLYELLGVSRSASKGVIEAACLRLGEVSRPDRIETPEAKARFAEIEKAYEILLNDQKRAEYDNAIARAGVTKTVRNLLSVLWLLLCAAWLSALFALGSLIGGIQGLVLSAAARPAVMNIAMAVISLFAAIRLLTINRIPVGLLATAGALTLVHLVNAIGMYLVYSTNGRISATSPLLMAPFQIVSMLVPTNSMFTAHPTGNWMLLPLPLCALVVALVSLVARSTKQESPNAGNAPSLHTAGGRAQASDRSSWAPSPFCIFFGALGNVGAYLLWPKYFAGGLGLPSWIAQIEAAICGLIAAHFIGRWFEASGSTFWRPAAAGILTMLATLLLVSYATAWSFYLFYAADSPFPIPNAFLTPGLTFASWVSRGTILIFQAPAIGVLVFAAIVGAVSLVRRPLPRWAALGCLVAFAPSVGLIVNRSFQLAQTLARAKMSDPQAQMYGYAIDSVVIGVALASCLWIWLTTRHASTTA